MHTASSNPFRHGSLGLTKNQREKQKAVKVTGVKSTSYPLQFTRQNQPRSPDKFYSGVNVYCLLEMEYHSLDLD